MSSHHHSHNTSQLDKVTQQNERMEKLRLAPHIETE